MFGSSKKETLLIKDVMTSCPRTATSDQHVITAKRTMNQYGIRHLPIVDKGELMGVLSDRDVRSIASTFKDRDEKELRVFDLILKDPYTVQETAPLREVLKNLIKQKIGSVIVLNGKKVTGIFTMTDACQVLLQHLK